MEALSVLDLTLTKGALSRQELNWHTIDIGSDHLAVRMTILVTTGRLENLPDIQAYNIRKADWDLFRSHLL
jgi:hypothetical protein